MRRARFDEYEFPSFRSILASVGLWCVALLTLALAIYCFFTNYARLVLLLLIILFGVSYVLYKRRKEHVASYQARRDKAAIETFNAVKSSSDKKKFAVFLRPFYTTDKIKSTEMITIPTQTGGSTTFTQVPVEHPLEDTIVKAFRYTMPVVALGKPGETFGVGRILVEDDVWQKAATELMDRAALIIFQPSSRPGSFWEMNEIMLHRYLSKTVFIVPPYPARWKELREDWNLLKKNMTSSGITLPDYRAEGLAFCVDAKGQSISEKLRLDSPKKLLETFIRLSSPIIRGRS
jgi:hypothetical protein